MNHRKLALLGQPQQPKPRGPAHKTAVYAGAIRTGGRRRQPCIDRQPAGIVLEQLRAVIKMRVQNEKGMPDKSAWEQHRLNREKTGAVLVHSQVKGRAVIVEHRVLRLPNGCATPIGRPQREVRACNRSNTTLAMAGGKENECSPLLVRSKVKRN